MDATGGGAETGAGRGPEVPGSQDVLQIPAPRSLSLSLGSPWAVDPESSATTRAGVLAHLPSPTHFPQAPLGPRELAPPSGTSRYLVHGSVVRPAAPAPGPLGAWCCPWVAPHAGTPGGAATNLQPLWPCSCTVPGQWPAPTCRCWAWAPLPRRFLSAKTPVIFRPEVTGRGNGRDSAGDRFCADPSLHGQDAGTAAPQRTLLPAVHSWLCHPAWVQREQ